MEKECSGCGEMFTPKRKNQKFHSTKCRENYHNNRKDRNYYQKYKDSQVEIDALKYEIGSLRASLDRKKDMLEVKNKEIAGLKKELAENGGKKEYFKTIIDLNTEIAKQESKVGLFETDLKIQERTIGSLEDDVEILRKRESRLQAEVDRLRKQRDAFEEEASSFRFKDDDLERENRSLKEEIEKLKNGNLTEEESEVNMWSGVGKLLKTGFDAYNEVSKK